MQASLDTKIKIAEMINLIKIEENIIKKSLTSKEIEYLYNLLMVTRENVIFSNN